MKLKSLLLSATAVSALAFPALAQEPAPVAEPAPSADATQEAAPQVPPALKEILKNVPDLLDKKWSTAMKVVMTDGESKNGTVDLGIKYQDMMHFVIDVAFHMAEGEVVQKGSLSILSDGEWMYIDADLPKEQMAMMPFQFPIKVKYALVQQALGVSGTNAGATLKDKLREQLTGMLGGDSFKSFQEEGSTETDRRFVFENEDAKGWLTFGRNMWLPKAMEVSGDGNVMKMSSTDSKFVEEFPEGTFVFTVAEGKKLQDISPLLEMQLGPPPSAGDEDLEF